MTTEMTIGEAVKMGRLLHLRKRQEHVVEAKNLHLELVDKIKAAGDSQLASLLMQSRYLIEGLEREIHRETAETLDGS